MVMVMGLASVAQAEWDVSRFVCTPSAASAAARYEHRNERRRARAKKLRRRVCRQVSQRCISLRNQIRKVCSSGRAKTRSCRRVKRLRLRVCKRIRRVCGGYVWVNIFPRPCRARKGGYCSCLCQRVSVGGYTFRTGFCKPRSGVLSCVRVSVVHPHDRHGMLGEGKHRALCLIASLAAKRAMRLGGNPQAAHFAQRARVAVQALRNQYLIRDHLWSRIRRLERSAKADNADVRGQTRLIRDLRLQVNNLERENRRQCLNLRAYMPGLRCRR